MFLECGSGLVAVVRRRNQSGTESFGDKKKDHFPNEMGGGLNLWPLTSTDQSRAPIGCLSLAKQTRKKKTNKQTNSKPTPTKTCPDDVVHFFFLVFFFLLRQTRRNCCSSAASDRWDRRPVPCAAPIPANHRSVCKIQLISMQIYFCVCVCVSECVMSP